MKAGLQKSALEPGRAIKAQFPIFAASRRRGLIYLDSAASAQKPRMVLDAMERFYTESYANVHRGLYKLSEEATECFEGSRETVRAFINAQSTSEIVFTRGTTESINIVCSSLGRGLQPGSEILVTILEHHSNFVPWQLLSSALGIKFQCVGIDAEGRLNREEFRSKLNRNTKVVAITHLANALGIELPVKELISEAHQVGAVVLVDAAQSVSHQPLDVQALGVDFLAFSGHKLYGPTGIGVLYGRRELLESMPPIFGGGDMIRSVTVERTTFNDLPYKFEAGTPNICGAVGLKSAIEFISGVGLSAIAAHERALVKQLERELSKIPAVRILGPLGEHQALVCFNVDNIHPHDLAQFLDRSNICIRAGHHCAQPLMNAFGINASARASLGVYNTAEDIDALITGIKEAVQFFG